MTTKTKANPQDILSKLVVTQREAKQADITAFWDLAHTIASGDEPNADDVSAILNRAGKSVTELETGVQSVLERRRLVEVLAKAEKHAKGRPDIE